MIIQKVLNEAILKLKKNNIQSSLLDSEILMSNVLKKKREYIIFNLNKSLSHKEISLYKNLISERATGKPIAHLTGKKFFWKYEFNVNKNVLIPRPDTEIMVEEILKITKNKSKLSILDVGVGSGCILLSILKENKRFLGTGVDLSSECLKICKKNITKLGIKNRIKLFKSDIDNFNYGKYDLIISNPPYIKKLDLQYLERDVVNFEPNLALDGGFDGTSEIRKVISKSSELMKKNGKLVLEIAFNQKLKVKELLKEKGFYINKVLKDLAKNDRCIVSTKI
jgi:release factor glutamine methyltransferase